MWRSLVVVLISLSLLCCKKTKTESSVPVVTTVGITALTDTSVKVGGKITSSGNNEITERGFCWSTTNSDPTLADDTVVVQGNSYDFVTQFIHLDPSTTYYVKAYAVNNLGVGYGNAISFSTNNAFPRITLVTLTGVPIVDSTLSATYTYEDFENDPDSASVVQWFSSTDTTSDLNESPVAGATALDYTITIADTLRYLRVGITPFSSRGSSPGGAVKSDWVGPVPKP